MSSKRERGYSILELLVVVAIIGLLSLISVPQFVSMYRSSVVKASMRDFTSTMRRARQLAATRNERTRVRFSTGVGQRTFMIERGGSDISNPSWTVVTPTRALDTTSYFDTSTNLPSPGGVERVINFLPNGSAVDNPAAGTPPTTLSNTNNKIVLRSSWKNMTYNQYAIDVSGTGQIKVTPSKWR